MALHHGVIPPSLHCRQPNPAVSWEDLPLRIARETVLWPDSASSPRVAGVSAFGIAGTNAHVVLEEAAARRSCAAPGSSRSTYLLPLSARSPEALRALVEPLSPSSWSDTRDRALDDVCWSAATRRTALDHRAVFVAGDNERHGGRAIRRSRRVSRRLPRESLRPTGGRRSPSYVPVRARSGSAWRASCSRTSRSSATALEECDAAARPYAEWSIVGQLHADPGAADCRLDQIDVIQPVLVAMAIAYARLWRSLGVEPDAVVGHSMGEVGAAHIAGVLDLDQAMQIICRRSALMRRTSGQGAMALVDLSMEDAQAHLGGI